MSTSYKNDDLPKFVGNEVKPGEIRRLIDMELHNDSRLVVVVSYNRVDESAVVALVSNLIEIATPRDILLPTALTSAPFDLSLLPDFLTLAARVLRARRKALGAALSDAEPGAGAATNQRTERLRVCMEELDSGGVDSILREFSVPSDFLD
jgi:hypothetical protein